MARDDGLGIAQAAQMRGAGMNNALASLQAGLTNLLAQREAKRQQELAAKQRAEDMAERARQFDTSTGLQRQGLDIQGLTARHGVARAVETQDREAAQDGRRFVREMMPAGAAFPAPEAEGPPPMSMAPTAYPTTPRAPPLAGIASKLAARVAPTAPDLRMLVPKGYDVPRRLERDPNYVDPDAAKLAADNARARAEKAGKDYEQMDAAFFKMVGAADDPTGELGRLLFEAGKLGQAGDATGGAALVSAVRDEQVRSKIKAGVTSMLARFRAGTGGWDDEAVRRYDTYLRTLAKQMGVDVPNLDDPNSGLTEEQLNRKAMELKAKIEADRKAKEEAASAAAAAAAKEQADAAAARSTGWLTPSQQPQQPQQPRPQVGGMPGGILSALMPPQQNPALAPSMRTATGVPLAPVALGERSYVFSPEAEAGIQAVISSLSDPEDVAALGRMVTSATRGETDADHQAILGMQSAPPYRSQEALRAAKAAGTQSNPVAGPGQSEHVAGAAIDIDPRIFERARQGDTQATRILGALDAAGWYRPNPTGDAPHWVRRKR